MALLLGNMQEQAIYTLDQAAVLLANSDCDLRDADRVTETLVGLGIRPRLLRPHDDGTAVSILDIWIAAHNVRTLRLVHGKSLPFTKLP